MNLGEDCSTQNRYIETMSQTFSAHAELCKECSGPVPCERGKGILQLFHEVMKKHAQEGQES